MTRARSARFRGDGGASLILALAFLTLLGSSAAILLQVDYTGFKTTEVVRGQQDRVYGADGGVDYGIQTMRTNTSYCPDSSAGAQTLPSQTINGKTVTVTCQTLSGSAGGGSAPGGATYSVVVTGYPGPTGTAANLSAAISTNTGQSGDTVNLGGDVFNAGGFSLPSSGYKLTVLNNLHELNAVSTYCTTAKAAARKPQVNGAWTCDAGIAGVFPVAPDPLPTLQVPATNAPATWTTGSGSSQCKVLYPGKYTSAPTFSTANNYLASGVYYFSNVGNISFDGIVVGGAQGTDNKLLGASACTTDAAAKAHLAGVNDQVNGSGVELVVDGNSRITIGGDSSEQMEFFLRVAGNPATEGTAGIGLIAPRIAGVGYSAWNAVPNPALTFGAGSGGGDPTSQVAFHGLVYEPNSSLVSPVLQNVNQVAMFYGGLVVQTLSVVAPSQGFSGGGTPVVAQIPVPSPATARTVLVTATATQAGEAPVTESSVIVLGTTSVTPPTVQSWRKN